MTELSVYKKSLEDGWQIITLGRIEAGNLDNVVALRPLEVIHLFLCAQAAEFSHIEL